MKKLIIGLISAAAGLALLAGPAIATSNSAPKATGGIGYTAYGLQRNAEFEAHQTANACSASGWNVNSANTMDVLYLGNHYFYTVNFSQSGNTLGGTLFDPYLPGTLTVFNGSISGNAVTFSVNYSPSSQGVRTFTGTIDTSGNVSGTWSETGTEAGTGTWTTSSQFATFTTTNCTGKGTFHYSDVNGNFYNVDIQFVKVVGNNTWFAGPAVSGNVGAGNWLYAKVQDGGTPGSNGDQIWGTFYASQTAALAGFGTTDPTDGPFAVTSGNLVVH